MASSLQLRPTMRNHLLLVTFTLLFSLSGCQPAGPQKEPIEIRTVENAAVNSMPVQPPPMITEQATELRPTEQLGPDGKPIARPAATPSANAQLEERILMPFAPLIAMDPVDGSKVSIRVETPVAEYKDRLYYFSSPGNKAAFLAVPESYATGSLSKY